MKVIIYASACVCAVGPILALVGYRQLVGLSGPPRNVAPGFSDAGMLLAGGGACLALLGAVLMVFQR